MNQILIYGIGYIPVQGNESDSHMFVKAEMTEELAVSVTGLPVYIEHDTTVQIGEVVRGSFDEHRNLHVELLIYENVMIISHLSDCISKKSARTKERNVFNGISVGTSMKLRKVNVGTGEYAETYTVPHEVRFTEFSIVAHPDSPGCVITDWKFL